MSEEGKGCVYFFHGGYGSFLEWSILNLLKNSRNVTHTLELTHAGTLGRSIENQRHGLETLVNISDIRDTFYFKPYNFTLKTSEDFVLTYREQEDKCECTYQHFKLFLL